MSAALKLLDEVREDAGAGRLEVAVRAGLPVALAEEILAVGLVSAAELDRLVVPRKTLAHRRGLGRLSPEQSDRLMRVMRVIAQARETLGGLDKAARWLRRPTRVLDGAAPLDLLDTDLGAQRVTRVLGWIDHGIAA